MRDWEKYIAMMCDFLHTQVHNAGFNSVALGLSGGVDSAVVAKLCVEVFKDNATAILMPSSASNPRNLYDAKNFAASIGMKHIEISIAPFEAQMRENLLVNFAIKDSINTNELDNLRIGNFCARIRIAILYDFSLANHSLVIGTSNKSEILLGYGTIFGDLAYAINPIGGLFKSEIFALAKVLGIPQEIIDKPPSADLFENQSDETDLGYSYKQIDAFLSAFEALLQKHNVKFNALNQKDYTDLVLIVDELEKMGFEKLFVASLMRRILRNAFKSHLPKIFNSME